MKINNLQLFSTWILGVVLVFATLVSLISCGKSGDNNPVPDPIVDVDATKTDHSNHGKISFTADWHNIGISITKPTNYIIRIGQQSPPGSGDNNPIDRLFNPAYIML